MSSDFEPVETIDGDFSKGFILLCDHARAELPARYGSLGLPEAEFSRHIAYDIGARAVTVGLAKKLGLPAVMTTFSRLLIDPNRGEDDPTLVMRLSDGTVVPGNHPISDDEVELRKREFYRPYDRAIDAAIERALATGNVPAILSVHSFTDNWKGFRRHWEGGILWDNDPRLPEPLIAELRAVDGLTIGDNEPYDGALRNDTLYRHCTRRGLANALIEIRQDLIGDDQGVDHWVDLLVPIIDRLNGLADLHEMRHFGSRTGPVDRLEVTDAPTPEKTHG